MNAILAALFTQSLSISGRERIALIIPLCLSIAIVYKTLRMQRLRDVTLAALVLWGTIVVGIYAVGVGLWIVFSLLA